MSYIGSTPTTQSFIAGTDTFSGTGAQTVYTLTRSVNSVNDILVVVNNVDQQPTAYAASGTTLTFTAAPSSGTNNIYVRYLTTTLQSIAPSQGSVGTDQLQTNAITPAKVLAGTYAIDISGNAATVTNGLYTNVDQTITVNKNFNSSNSAIATATGSLNTLTALGTGGAAMMTFHRPGAFAAYFGLDSDNVWKIGGWSYGAVSYPMLYPTSTNAPGTAPVYGCRAWVNFNGTGTVAIRASGNVSSITDNGVGAYTVNFTTAMTDANYSAVVTGDNFGTSNVYCQSSIARGSTAAGARIGVVNSSNAVSDALQLNVSIFR